MSYNPGCLAPLRGLDTEGVADRGLAPPANTCRPSGAICRRWGVLRVSGRVACLREGSRENGAWIPRCRGLRRTGH